MKPTLEQSDIIDAGLQTKDNLLVVARAGAAKTTTIKMLARAFTQQYCEQRGQPPADDSIEALETAFLACRQPPFILCLAFNKKIAQELQASLPSSARAQTLHSLGNAAWKDFIGRFPKTDEKKCFFLLSDEIKHLDSEEQSEAYESMADTLKMIKQAKSAGYLPEGTNARAKPLCTGAELDNYFEEEPTDMQINLVNRVLARSFALALQGQIDFDDMVYLPAIMPVSFPSFPITMVDESQDLSPLNHAILRKMVKKNRLIAVGDPCQAIYAFRGALESSMQELRESFQMREHYLTVCFRSSEAVVRNARWRAPDMQWGPTPPEGSVTHLTHWGPETLKSGDAIICRNNAPLFRMALTLMQVGLNPELMAGDIIPSLIKIMKKLGKPNDSTAEAFSALADWHDKESKKTKSPTALEDKRLCIQLFLDKAETLGAAMALLEKLAQQTGRIKLMTGHKSKGLEFHRVFFLDPHLVRKEGQDPNLKYVIETRAKNDLFYVTSETFGVGPDAN